MLSGCSGSSDPTDGKNIVIFNVNGGILSYGTSSTDSTINYAYHPGTYVKDPSLFPNYKLQRNGYDFTGWYTSAECKPSEKWDFNTLLTEEMLTLYAGWELSIKHTFSVNYIDVDGSTKTLGTYKVTEGARFNDNDIRYADRRTGYTKLGYYSDPDCTIPWDSDTTHPGGASDLDIPVYVKYIEGNWKLVDTFEELKSALRGANNVYLTADIDCDGKELYVSSTYNKIFEGNGFKVSDFTIRANDDDYYPVRVLFNGLGSTAEIRNVSFEGAIFELTTYDYTESIKISALALSMVEGAKLTNVTVSGTLTTNYEGELPCLNHAFWSEDCSAADIPGFEANITKVIK